MLTLERSRRAVLLTGAVLIAAAAPPPQPYQAPQHSIAPPMIGSSTDELASLANVGIEIERDRSPQWQLAEHRRLTATLASISPQRKGIVDVYVLSAALDSDPVFGREAREAGRVLGRRYGAAGHAVVLAGSDGSGPSTLPTASPSNIALVLARLAEVMNKKEDVLVVYLTSHGAPLGIVYNDANNGYGAVSPARAWSLLNALGLERRVVIVSACYSGVFVPMLASDDSVVITAADASHTSFGCRADNDWTFFGDALINNALRKKQPLAAAGAEAQALVATWEGKARVEPSNPQVSIGSRARLWLDVLDARVPSIATAPVGRPSLDTLDAR